MHAALSARINKTDRNDAHGIAQMMRVGLFKAVHVKTPASQRRRLLLTSRKLLQRKVQDLENDLRGSLRNFGLKVGVVGAASFEWRIRELVADEPFVSAVDTRSHLPNLQIVYATGSPEVFSGHTLSQWERVFFKPFDPVALVAALSGLSGMNRAQYPAGVQCIERPSPVPAHADAA